MYRCKKCNIPKEKTEFYVSNKATCKACILKKHHLNHITDENTLLNSERIIQLIERNKEIDQLLISLPKELERNTKVIADYISKQTLELEFIKSKLNHQIQDIQPPKPEKVVEVKKTIKAVRRPENQPLRITQENPQTIENSEEERLRRNKEIEEEIKARTKVLIENGRLKEIYDKGRKTFDGHNYYDLETLLIDAERLNYQLECKDCKETKPYTEFRINKGVQKRSGFTFTSRAFHHSCKKCMDLK